MSLCTNLKNREKFSNIQNQKFRHFIFNSKHQHILLILVMLSHLNLLYHNKNNYSPDKIAIHIAVFKVIIYLKTNITQCIYHHLSVKHEIHLSTTCHRTTCVLWVKFETHPHTLTHDQDVSLEMQN